jgi:hypothetical protein
LTLSNTAELFDALYNGSYEAGGASVRDKLSFVEARRLCRVIFAWFCDRYEIVTSEGQPVLPATLRDKYFRGQVRALLRYKYLEEQDLEELEREEQSTSRTTGEVGMKGRVTYGNFQDMVERSVRGGVELVQEYHRLLAECPDDHYFENLTWPSSERYDLRRTNTLDGALLSLLLSADMYAIPFRTLWHKRVFWD